MSLHFSDLSLSSRAIHADDVLNTHPAVAPPMHVSTTFRYSDNPDDLFPIVRRNAAQPGPEYCYSREAAPTASRLETILSSVLHGDAIVYSSGLSAFHALLVFLNPQRVAIGDGYHGCHGVLGIQKKLTGVRELGLDCVPEDLHPGDVVHVETPLNPTGELRDLDAFAAKAHARGAFLTVDATFGPPPLQDPFLHGADLVMHSGTKYIGGHSDLLCGVLVVNPKHRAKGWTQQLRDERTYLGSVPGSLEAWLGVRSVRTLELRVLRQSDNAMQLVGWLAALWKAEGAAAASEDAELVKKLVAEVKHASVQAAAMNEDWPQKQMPRGYGPVFTMMMATEVVARRLPSKLGLFHHATSLGGIESLIEWRPMTDPYVDMRVVRVSVGIEAWEDLRDDLLQAFKSLAAEMKL